MDVKITEIKNHPFYHIIELIKLQSYNRRELINFQKEKKYKHVKISFLIRIVQVSSVCESSLEKVSPSHSLTQFSRVLESKSYENKINYDFSSSLWTKHRETSVDHSHVKLFDNVAFDKKEKERGRGGGIWGQVHPNPRAGSLNSKIESTAVLSVPVEPRSTSHGSL